MDLLLSKTRQWCTRGSRKGQETTRKLWQPDKTNLKASGSMLKQQLSSCSMYECHYRLGYMGGAQYCVLTGHGASLGSIPGHGPG